MQERLVTHSHNGCQCTSIHFHSIQKKIINEFNCGVDFRVVRISFDINEVQQYCFFFLSFIGSRGDEWRGT